jgi:hypothetical protein
VSAIRRTSGAARAAALLSLGALAVHQLRYLLAYGHDAEWALSEQGHAYLSHFGGIAVGLGLAVLLGTLLAPAARRRLAGTGCRGMLRFVAPLYTAALLASFCSQEIAEGALSSGHPDGLNAAVANGGWIAIPLAILVGLLCALGTRALERVDDALSAPKQPRGRLPRSPAVPAPNPAAPRLALGCLGLAFGIARRPPPRSLLV